MFFDGLQRQQQQGRKAKRLELAWLNRRNTSHQQEQSNQEKYRPGNFRGLVAGLVFPQEENYGMDEYNEEKSA